MDHQAFAQLLGNYGEFVGAIAVVATLVYLATQIKQSTQATKAASRDAAVAHSLSFFEQQLDSQVLARADYKLKSGEDLDDFEKTQLQNHQYYNLKVFENIFTQYRDDLFSENEWGQYRKILADVLNGNEMAQGIWKSTPGHWTFDFRQEGDSLLVAK